MNAVNRMMLFYSLSCSRRNTPETMFVYTRGIDSDPLCSTTCCSISWHIQVKGLDPKESPSFLFRTPYHIHSHIAHEERNVLILRPFIGLPATIGLTFHDKCKKTLSLWTLTQPYLRREHSVMDDDVWFLVRRVIDGRL